MRESADPLLAHVLPQSLQSIDNPRPTFAFLLISALSTRATLPRTSAPLHTDSMGASDKSFRFLELNGELRNDVYALLLCAFVDPEPKDMETLSGAMDPKKMTLTNGTAILSVNTQVHHEAYDVSILHSTTQDVHTSAPHIRAW
jgi:hypothetical protein